MAFELWRYVGDPVFIEISRRLMRFDTPIRLEQHIHEIIEIGRTVSEGITFAPRANAQLAWEVANATRQRHRAFHYDDRRVWMFKLAALATDGAGYREIGKPSLHWAIGAEKCNVHLDELGFVEVGPDGETFFTPELVMHVGDELLWRSILRPQFIRAFRYGLPKFLAAPAAKLLDHTYLVGPNARNNYGFPMGMGGLDPLTGMRTPQSVGDQWRPRFGAGVKVELSKSVNMRFEHTCGNGSCSDRSTVLNFEIKMP